MKGIALKSFESTNVELADEKQAWFITLCSAPDKTGYQCYLCARDRECE
jgi:hypothetical protein